MKRLLSLVLTLLLLVLFLLGCGKKTPLDDAHKDFAGKWVAADGTFVQFFLDGTGNLKSGSTEVTGGAVTFGQGTVTIKLFGIGKGHADHPTAPGSRREVGAGARRHRVP